MQDRERVEKPTQERRTILSERYIRLNEKNPQEKFSNPVRMILGKTEVIASPHKIDDQANSLSVFHNGERHTIISNRIKIGRNPTNGNHVIIPASDLSVSGAHCTIDLSSEEMAVNDHSTNGTEVWELRSIRSAEVLDISKGKSIICSLGEGIQLKIGNEIIKVTRDENGRLVLTGGTRHPKDAQPLKPRIYTIGNDQTNEIELNSENSAPFHARITDYEGAIEIEDLGSGKQTQVYAFNADLSSEGTNREVDTHHKEDTESKSQGENALDKERAEELALRVFMEGAGYIAGTLSSIKGATPQDMTRFGVWGYSEGFPFVQGKHISYERHIDDQRLIDDVMGIYANTTSQADYSANILSGRTISFWAKANHTRKTYDVQVGEKIIKPKGFLRKEIKEPIYEQRVYNINGFTGDPSWMRYTFVSEQNDGRGRNFNARLLMPPDLAQIIDKEIDSDPRIAYEIVKNVCKITVGHDVLGTEEGSEIRLYPTTQLVVIDRTSGRDIRRTLPYARNSH